MSPSGPAYLVRDLDGCSVVTEEGETLGVLKDVYPTGSNDVFVVRRENQEFLIPALRQVIVNIDLPGRRIVVRLPEGLREIYET